MGTRFQARRITLGVLAAAVVLLGSAPAALASRFHSGGGSVQLGPPTTLWERTFGSTIIRDQEGFLGLGLTGGTIVGTGTINVLALVHPDGSENFVARWSAPAAVNGQGGTVTVRFLGFDDGTSFSGTLFAAGSQGLRGFLADGHFSGTDATGAGSYTISYVGP